MDFFHLFAFYSRYELKKYPKHVLSLFKSCWGSAWDSFLAFQDIPSWAEIICVPAQANTPNMFWASINLVKAVHGTPPLLFKTFLVNQKLSVSLHKQIKKVSDTLKFTENWCFGNGDYDYYTALGIDYM